MALTGPQITSAIMSARNVLGGPQFALMASGIGAGVAAWAVGNPANLSLVGVSTGVIGVGALAVPTTRLVVAPGQGQLMTGLLGAGVAGPLASSLAFAVGVGISTAFSAYAQYLGTSAGVAAGQDVSTIVVANAVTLTAILMGTMAGAMGGTGGSLANLAQGLANGISLMLLGSTGTGTVIGTAGPSPGTGVTNSVVV